MTAKEKVRKSFEDYYDSGDCGANRMFLTKGVIENIYLRAYVDGFQNAVNSLKVEK